MAGRKEKGSLKRLPRCRGVGTGNKLIESLAPARWEGGLKWDVMGGRHTGKGEAGGPRSWVSRWEATNLPGWLGQEKVARGKEGEKKLGGVRRERPGRGTKSRSEKWCER